MKSPAEYMASRRKSEDKSSWKDQLSPRLKSIRGFKRRPSAASPPPLAEEEEFRIVHFPDRPARRITQEEIPSEEECRRFLIGLRRESVQSQQSQFSAGMVSDDGDDEDIKSWRSNSTATRLGLALQPPEDARSDVTDEGIMTARTYSPHPFVGEATEVKLERMPTKYLSPNTRSLRPPPEPLVQHGHFNEAWSWRTTPTQLIPRSSPLDDSFPPIQCHVRKDSGADPLCRVCHVGLAEASHVCQTCSDEYAPPDEKSPPLSFQPRPPTLYRPKATIPHTLDQIASHRASPSITSSHRASLSVSSSHPASPPSPLSPVVDTVHTVVTLPPRNPPLTPLSALPTPAVLARMEQHAEEDVYEGALADYYFDDENFEENHGKQRVDPDGFMRRELSLEEYDRAFASPVSPGPGWI